jgi:hypothetical protein
MTLAVINGPTVEDAMHPCDVKAEFSADDDQPLFPAR